MSNQPTPQQPAGEEKLLKLLEEANASPAVQVGACLYLPPGGPQPHCFQLTPEQCAAIGGTYVGGPCP